MAKASPSILRSWRQNIAYFQIYFQEALAYRATMVIWILTDVIFAITLPLVWLSATKGGEISGFSGSDFVLYYIISLMLNNFIACHFAWDMNYEIREGLLTSQLIRPSNYLSFMFMRNMAWRIIRTGMSVPLLIVFILLYYRHITEVNLHLGWMFWAILLLGHVLSFMFVVMIGSIALFTEEAEALFEAYYFPAYFLGGLLFPIAVLPEWAQTLAHILPFYYTTGVPTLVALGRLDEAAMIQTMGMQLIWIILSFIGFRILWKAGLKRYTGVGL